MGLTFRTVEPSLLTAWLPLELRVGSAKPKQVRNVSYIRALAGEDVLDFSPVLQFAPVGFRKPRSSGPQYRTATHRISG